MAQPQTQQPDRHKVHPTDYIYCVEKGNHYLREIDIKSGAKIWTEKEMNAMLWHTEIEVIEFLTQFFPSDPAAKVHPIKVGG